MADYFPLIARAVAGLPQNTESARRALYGRARDSLITLLRGRTKLEVARERELLEEAIRRVEAQTAHNHLRLPSGTPTKTGRASSKPVDLLPKSETRKAKKLSFKEWITLRASPKKLAELKVAKLRDEIKQADAALIRAQHGCSVCGNDGPHETRYVPIVAQTKYGEERKYVNKDGIAIWKLSICPICLPKVRLSYMDNQIRSARNAALLGIFLFINGTVGIVWVSTHGIGPTIFTHSNNIVESIIEGPVSHLNTMALLAMLFGIAAGVIMTPIAIIISVVCWIRRRWATERDDVPVSMADKCFLKEAERIVGLLGGAQVDGAIAESFAAVTNLRVPPFKSLKELTEEERGKVARQGNASSTSEWTLLNIAQRTREDLLSNLPAEWKSQRFAL
jgi:hypothetical protein